MPTADPHLADNLRRLMGMHRVGQKEVAERLGTTKQSVWEWAAGRKMPRWATLVDLAGLFGVELSDLLAEPEQAVLAGARAFHRAPIRFSVRLPTVRPSPDFVDEFNAEILKMPPKGLSGQEIGEFRKAQRESKSDKPGGSTTENG
jgi:transcriptional regulator with XRE-family HTH domain